MYITLLFPSEDTSDTPRNITVDAYIYIRRYMHVYIHTCIYICIYISIHSCLSASLPDLAARENPRRRNRRRDLHFWGFFSVGVNGASVWAPWMGGFVVYGGRWREGLDRVLLGLRGAILSGQLYDGLCRIAGWRETDLPEACFAGVGIVWPI